MIEKEETDSKGAKMRQRRKRKRRMRGKRITNQIFSKLMQSEHTKCRVISDVLD